MTRRCLATVVAGACALSVLSSRTSAQHQEHHPAVPAGQTVPPAAVRPPAGPVNPPVPPKALYPSLIDLPVLTPERRGEIDRFAADQMVAGTKLMSEGLQKLNVAARTKDYAAMQQATDQLRDGLARFDSGLGARRALVEGRAPGDIALQWFRREMNLAPAAANAAPASFTLAWYHYAGMLILASFALLMIWMHFHRMRRAEKLLTDMATGTRVPPPPAPPASAKHGQE